MKWWRLDYCLDVCTDEQPIMMSTHLDYCLDVCRVIFVKHFPYLTYLYLSNFFFFLNCKLISKLRFEDMVDVKRNKIIQLHTISKKIFRSASTNRKLMETEKEFHVSFLVQSCLGKNGFSLNSFWTHLILDGLVKFSCILTTNIIYYLIFFSYAFSVSS